VVARVLSFLLACQAAKQLDLEDSLCGPPAGRYLEPCSVTLKRYAEVKTSAYRALQHFSFSALQQEQTEMLKS